MKKVLTLLFLFLMVLSFTTVHADDLADVTKAGVLRFGVAPEYIPFIFFDKDNNETGIDVALMDEICRRMGVKLQIVDLAFDGIIDSLNIGQVDVIGGALSKTDSRAEQIDFTRVYYTVGAQFVGLSSLQKPASVDLESFRDMKIGVQKGTSFDQWIKTNMVTAGYVGVRNVYTYNSAADEMKALDRKDVDLVLLDQDVYEEVYKASGKYQVFYEGFTKENYAFGMRKNSTLTSVVSGHLTDMLKDGTAQTIANRFFSMNFNEAEATIARPSQLATPTPVTPVINVPTAVPAQCRNGMAFVSDVSIYDGQRVSQGESFRKTWRVINTGTCTWTTDYTFVYVSGDQMSGQNIRVPMTVGPNQTVDLSVDMIAPYRDGNYQGNWQMRSPEGMNFGQTIWVKVSVGNAAPQPQPRPSQPDGQRFAPIDINYFYPDYYAGSEGSCVRAYWSAKGASIVEVTVDGVSLYKGDVVDPGSLKLCGPITEGGDHYVQLYAFNVTTDAYASFTYTTNYEGQRGKRPTINYFYADSTSGRMGDSTTVYWDVSDAAEVDITVDGNYIERHQGATGSAPVYATIQSVGKHKITLIAHNVIDDATSTITYTMKKKK